MALATTNKITTGVSVFDGIMTGWYGWARVEAPGHGYKEGGVKHGLFAKLRARLDARRLARELRAGR